MPPDENHRADGEREEEEDHHEVTRFYTNPIAKPIPQTPENAAHKHQSSVDDTIVALNMRAALRNGLEGSSEDASFHDDSLQDEREEEPEPPHHPHPAGQAGQRTQLPTAPPVPSSSPGLLYTLGFFSFPPLFPSESKSCFSASYLVQIFLLLSQ